MRHICLILALLMLPVFSTLGVFGLLPAPSLPLSRLGWYFVLSLVLYVLIQTLSPKFSWSRLRQVPLLIIGAALPIAIAMAILTSWLSFSAGTWLLIAVPAALAVVFFSLWLFVTAFADRDFSKYFLATFLGLSAGIDAIVWHTLILPGASG